MSLTASCVKRTVVSSCELPPPVKPIEINAYRCGDGVCLTPDDARALLLWIDKVKAYMREVQILCGKDK